MVGLLAGVNAMAQTQPAAPSLLTASALTTTSIRLTWQDNSTNETGFAIERSSASTFTSPVAVATTAANATIFTNTGLTEGTQYFYRIRAANVSVYSAYTAIVNTVASLATPTALTATAASPTTVNLTWVDNSTRETGYSIERSSASTFTSPVVVATTAANATTFTNTGLTEGTQYFYRVRATAASSNSAYSATASITTPLPAPTALTATAASPTTINLTWVDNSTSETGFSIERSTNGTSYVVIATANANATSYADQNLTEKTQYFYQIRSVKGTVNSTYTTAVNTTTQPALPIAPTSLVAAALSNASTQLTWVDNSTTETGFAIERSAASTFTSPVVVTTTAANATTFTNTALTEGTQYFYRIRAVNVSAYSAYTAIVNAVTSLATPTALTATAASPTTVNLTWVDNSTRETGYSIERSSASTFTSPVVVATTAANATTFTNTGLAEGTQYFYRIRATAASSNSAYSATASISTPLPAPTALTATAASPTTINLTWVDNSTTETGFSIERSTNGTSYAVIATATANATSYADQNLTEKTQYFYQIRSVKGTVNSTYTTAVNTTTQPALPIAPTSLVAAALSNASTQLTWVDNSTTETGFAIERSAASTFTSPVVVTTTAANATTFTNTALTEGTQYFYRIRAVNVSVYSAYTAIVNAVTSLATPTALTATAGSSTTVQLSWSDISTKETGYSIERSTVSTFTSPVVAGTTAANVTTFTNAGLTEGAQYFYRVRALSGSMSSTYTATVNTFTLLATPTTLAAPTGTSSTVQLSWRDNSTKETGYSIERSVASTFTNPVVVATTLANVVTYTNTGLVDGTQYFYRVRATNGTAFSAYSNTVSRATPLLAPTVPTATVASASSINLGWTDNSTTETGFAIERSPTGQANSFVVIATVGAGIRTYNDATGLSACTRYYYRIRAVNALGQSAYTATVNTITATATPLAPSLLVPTVFSLPWPAKVKLDWKDNATNETAYQLERSTSPTTGFALIATLPANTITYTDENGFEILTKYYYRIRALNGGCASAYTTSSYAFIEWGDVPDQEEFNFLKELYISTKGQNWHNKTNWPTVWPKTATSEEMSTWFGVRFDGGDLIALYLSDNNLQGDIPSSLTKMKNMVYIFFHGNKLTGPIPTDIGNLTKLQSLLLVYNNMSGELPSSLGNLINMYDFQLGMNQFIGSIPKSLGNLKKAIVIQFSGNLLEGPIPPELGDCTDLLSLELNSNRLAGPIPPELANLTKLQGLYISDNQLTGSVPSGIFKMKTLSHVWLYNNQFTENTLPTDFDMPNLVEFYIQGSKFKGALPPSISKATQLVNLLINSNEFTGSLPDLGQCKNLWSVDASNNQLSGTIGEMVNMKQLQILQLANNQFNAVHASLFSSTCLLYLHNNRISQIVGSLGTLHPCFAEHYIYDNYLNFDQLEPLARAGMFNYSYNPQKEFPKQAVSATSSVDTQLRIEPSPPIGTSASTTVTWEKQEGSNWVNVNNVNQDATQRTFVRALATEAQGNYRWSAVNSSLGFSINSGPITVSIQDAELPSNYKAKALYNGNIASMRWRTDPAYATPNTEHKGMYLYDYDEKYQLKEAQWADPNFTLNTFALAKNKFRVTAMNYDPNGNIQSLNRYNADAVRTNNFAYTYAGNTNQLESVSGYKNYTYNAIGQMTSAKPNGAVGGGADQYVDYDVTGKVTKVYSDVDRKIPTVAFTYDDRGFRLIKTDYTNAIETKQTWYIRDASGNVTSIYERTAVEGTTNPVTWNALAQAEVPIYGSGKIGTYYPRDGSTAYELTDHLGNVRAILKKQVNGFTATMEDNGAGAVATNPRAVEAATFKNIPQTAMRDARMNYTKTGDNPAYSAYLYWVNGMAGKEAKDKAIGPALALKVNPRDKLNISTYAKYEKKANYSRNAPLTVLATALGGTFALGSGLETATRAVQAFNGALPATMASTANDVGTTPFAYLNYLVLNEQFVAVDGGARRVPEAAGFDPGYEALAAHAKVEFLPITINTKGYVYIWVSNESEATKVWFDDLAVTHNLDIVTQATDYGPWGDVTREQKTNELDIYRYAYQGQYAEKDEETGWEHYELREYDAMIGRWNTTDPKKQYFSRYLAMGNNPVSSTDPDGGDDVYFNKDGSYNRTDDRSWFFELFFGHRGFQDQGDGGFKSISFNDQADALKFGKDGIYGGITDISNPEVKSMVSEGIQNFQGKYPNPTFGDLATGSMQYGPLDYTGKVSAGYLTVLGGRAYNDQDFGNFLWGASMQVLNVSYGNVKLGSELNGFWNGKLQNGKWNESNPGYKRITWGGDSAADQAAIRGGYSWGVRNFGLRKFTF